MLSAKQVETRLSALLPGSAHGYTALGSRHRWGARPERGASPAYRAVGAEGVVWIPRVYGYCSFVCQSLLRLFHDATHPPAFPPGSVEGSSVMGCRAFRPAARDVKETMHGETLSYPWCPAVGGSVPGCPATRGTHLLFPARHTTASRRARHRNRASPTLEPPGGRLSGSPLHRTELN